MTTDVVDRPDIPAAGNIRRMRVIDISLSPEQWEEMYVCFARHLAEERRARWLALQESRARKAAARTEARKSKG